MIREPIHSGSFYPNSKEEILKLFNEYNLKASNSKLIKNIAGIIPHAGYMFSGRCASTVYNEISKLGKPEHIIIFSPSHTGLGEGISDMDFLTPMGTVKIDPLINEIKNFISINNRAHIYEHAIEVHLPFLQFIFGEINVIPIIINSVREGLIDYLSRLEKTLFIASSDFIHHGERFEYIIFKENIDKNIKKKDEEVFSLIKNKKIESLKKKIEG